MKDDWKKYIVQHNDKKINEVLSDMLGKNKKIKRGYASVRINNAWKIEMGEMINSYTSKIYFSGGKLTVYLTSAPLRSELSMSKQKVIDLINTACQEQLIKEVIFR